MDEHLGIRKLPRDFGGIGDVIEMAVREPEANDVPAMFLGFIEQRRDGVVRRVENDRLLRCLIGDEIRVRLGDAAAVHDDLHVCLRISSSVRMLAIDSSGVSIGGLPSSTVAAKSSASKAYRS